MSGGGETCARGRSRTGERRAAQHSRAPLVGLLTVRGGTVIVGGASLAVGGATQRRGGRSESPVRLAAAAAGRGAN